MAVAHQCRVQQFRRPNALSHFAARVLDSGHRAWAVHGLSPLHLASARCCALHVLDDSNHWNALFRRNITLLRKEGFAWITLQRRKTFFSRLGIMFGGRKKPIRTTTSRKIKKTFSTMLYEWDSATGNHNDLVKMPLSSQSRNVSWSQMVLKCASWNRAENARKWKNAGLLALHSKQKFKLSSFRRIYLATFANLRAASMPSGINSFL